MSSHLTQNSSVLYCVAGGVVAGGIVGYLLGRKSRSGGSAGGKVIYEVNIDVNEDVADDFESWLRPHANELVELDGFQGTELLRREVSEYVSDDAVPNVLFVLGGPGAGKGTQCGKIVERFGWEHISAGDCLRAERNDPNSPNGALINKYIENGEIVPVEITVKLLLQAMKKSPSNNFLIDGFPRNADNLQGWYKTVGEKARVHGVLFFDCTEEIMESRLIKRGNDAESSGGKRRKDDNPESIRKRFRTYVNDTRPIIDTFAQMGKVYRFDATLPSPDEVFQLVEPVLAEIDAELTPPPMRRLTQCYYVESRADLQQYFDVHSKRLRGDGLKRFGGKMSITRRILARS